MYLYFFKKGQQTYYSITEEILGKKAIDFIIPSNKGLTKIRCNKKHIIDEYEINSYGDLANYKYDLMEKYKFRMLLIKSELPNFDLYKLQLMLLGNIFFDVTIKTIDYEKDREEIQDIQIWEVFNKDTALEGFKMFDIEKEIPEDVKELLIS